MFKGGISPGRILVVDDQPGNLRVVAALLSRNGHEVLTASNGHQALEIAEDQLPDLILLDLMMPDMDGFQVLAEIKRNEALMRLPVVCLTAARDREQLLRAFDAGARSEEHTSELQSRENIVCRLLLEKKKHEG